MSKVAYFFSVENKINIVVVINKVIQRCINPAEDEPGGAGSGWTGLHPVDQPTSDTGLQRRV